MRQVVFFLINAYQRYISVFLPPRCRYYPSCSQYAREAVEHHGVARGLWLGVKRVCRCHPFADSGYDPVPDRFTVFRPHGLSPGKDRKSRDMCAAVSERGDSAEKDSAEKNAANSLCSASHQSVQHTDQVTDVVATGTNSQFAPIEQDALIEKKQSTHMLSSVQQHDCSDIDSGHAGLSTNARPG